jgi:hypothetical protein
MRKTVLLLAFLAAPAHAQDAPPDDKRPLAQKLAKNMLLVRLAQELGAVDLTKLHEDGEAIVSLKREIKEIEATAKKDKARPAPCSHPVVAAIVAGCSADGCAQLADNLDVISAYSVQKRKTENEATIERTKTLILAKYPDIWAALEAKVAGVLQAVRPK